MEREIGMYAQVRKRCAAVLLTCALAFGFAWFDLPGHGSSFLTGTMALGTGVADGHTLYLLGMLAVVVLMAACPRMFERHLTAWLCLAWGVGTVAVISFSLATSLGARAVSVVAMGFVDVLFLNLVIALVLACLRDRAAQILAISCALAAKTLVVYASDCLLSDTAQTALLICLPTLCVVFGLGARWLLNGDAGTGETDARLKFKPPLSTVLLGMLFVASVIFATTRAVSPLGFWGSDYPLSGWEPLVVVVATAVYVVLCYLTLAKASAGLLFRFLPALMILFLLYAVLYSECAAALGLSAETIDLLRQYAELYGQTFVWTVALLAMRKLALSPVRVTGILFTAFTIVELLLQGVLTIWSNASLVVVLLLFFIVFGLLIWALWFLYGREGKARLDAYECVDGVRAADVDEDRASSPASLCPGESVPACIETANSRLSLAAEHGLSQRETDVFLLLAQGRSRRFICDELFIADGTASTYISRVYEKLGVHSKQELLTLVYECEDGRPPDLSGRIR